ncbi:MAG TPA: ThuA domain-containing protein [Planctomycetota bacterium]|nr:ThuA domain-containing protein [Planctomycetota bacterium]
MNHPKLALLLCAALLPLAAIAEDQWLVFEGKDGPGKGKHVVFLSGDEEYRSEEALPMLAKILSQRHGFKCTVLFSLDKDGTINPNLHDSLPGAEALDTADAVVMSLRFRSYPDDVMKHFDNAYMAGKAFIGLRTATHAFAGLKGPYAKYNWNNNGKEWPKGFGRQVLGETWVSHWGNHMHQATRGIIEESAKDDPILRGVSDIFGDTDVYEAHPPADAKILVRGSVLVGMNHDDKPLEGKKNDPMQPIVWTRVVKNEAGKENKALCTTMGAATDLQNEALRRIIVNGVYWGVGLEVPAKADVTIVDEYKPSAYRGDGYRFGMKPSDLALGKAMPALPTASEAKKKKTP